MNPGKTMTLDELKTWNKEVVNHVREEKIVAGFTFMGIQFDSDERSRANIAGACTLALVLLGQGQDFPQGFTWRAANNVDVPMNAQAIIGLAMTAGNYVTTCYSVSWYHKAQIDAIDNILDVQDYDVTQGWPS